MSGIKYNKTKQLVESMYDSYSDWEKVKNLSMFGGDTVQEKLNNYIAPFHNMKKDELTEKEWKEIVDELSTIEEEIEVTKLGRRVNNFAEIPSSKYSTWKMYENKLIRQNWSERSINNIRNSSFEILKSLSMDTREDGPVKGLVIGNVQSGKTANMAGLMAMAADNGFNYFIILSGVIEKLREQTAGRLYDDMNVSGTSHLHWHQIDKPSIKSNIPEHDISKLSLSSRSKDKYFTVSLKNKTRLRNLFKWLTSDENKAAQMKILVIDDEADQASVNTKDIEEEEKTAINELINDLVHYEGFAGMNYIAYTATPYANVLNEVGDDTLYPRDFITLLESSEDYIGPKQIFGMEEPETIPSVDIVRDISDYERDSVRKYQKDGIFEEFPPSLEASLKWFLISLAALRTMDFSKPVSMLIHTSFRVDHHQLIADNIEKFLKKIKGSEEMIRQMKTLYLAEQNKYKRSDFLSAMPSYSTSDSVPDYPEWKEVEYELRYIMGLDQKEYISHIPIGEEGEPAFHEGLHLVIDNSRAKADDQIIRLVYPNEQQLPNKAPAFIVIGGNTLSRGLTLEGLVSTYFLRTTNQADTLMQMGRWFGYRKKYELFPRVWLDRLAYERYGFLSQMNEELREEIKTYSTNGLTPSDFAPRVKNSPNYQLIRITSNNKMQSAREVEFNFAGYNSQTIYFDKNIDTLRSNIEETKKFLNRLQSPKARSTNLIWEGVSNRSVKDFLQKYVVCSMDKKMSNLSELIGWIEKNSETLADWSVILSSTGELNKDAGDNEKWNIHGYNPAPVKRTKLKNRSTDDIVSIGALRSPRDLMADVEVNNEINEDEKKAYGTSKLLSIREKYGYGDVPQLLIYRVDKGNQTEESYREHHKDNHANRAPLNFPEDIIGINILIPGKAKKGNLATYISARVNRLDDEVNENEFRED
ncbi:Z1 domain-containing protein [Alkalibacterium subtropicum]|uniref:Z1 domain-containing protein n=1 Tax=Alkalibacterium subtropicum TaxID=753702 RepID=A0A1I1FLA8_9LACT|nr:Z1 domain-containing protein [Alkalibacterium subtropicum]SFC00299.1 Z1 domain-containing protein [Alkalibacterium subtropicum]